MVSRLPRAHEIAIVLAAAGLLALGLWLRGLGAPWHNNVWTLDLLGYYEPQADALRAGRWLAWLGTWEGLHPPLTGALHGAIMTMGGHIPAHRAASVLASLAAPLSLWPLWRGRGRIAGAFALCFLGWMALSPLQAHYALNPSPYPWALLLSCGSIGALARAESTGSARSWAVAAVLGGAAVNTHVLAFSIVLGQVLWVGILGHERRLPSAVGVRRWAAILGVLCLPMLLGALSRSADPWTFHITGADTPWWRIAGTVLGGRFGDGVGATALGGALALGGAAGLAAAPRGPAGLLALAALGWIAALALFFALGVADPRLTHYWLTPHALLLALGALGWTEAGAALGRAWGPRSGVAVLVGLGLISIGWGSEAIRWQTERAALASLQIEAAGAAPGAVRDLYLSAGQGDVVAYLWDHRFLDDEPEHLDPVAARWPVERLGAPCVDDEVTRGLCSEFEGATFYADPSSFSGALWELEEPVRLIVNRARAPGRAVFLLLEGPEAPAHPWPVEALLSAHGAQRIPIDARITQWTLPVGARIDPPAEPAAPPSEARIDHRPEGDL